MDLEPGGSEVKESCQEQPKRVFIGSKEAKGHVLAHDPIGKSGGAIFGMRVMGLNAVQPWYTPKLVGIPTEWKGKQILGASAAALIPLLDRLVAPR